MSGWLHVTDDPVEHAVPSASGAPVHVPVSASQVPAVTHGFVASQTTGLPPVQTPLAQTSVCVQALPSLQAVPSPFAGVVHAPDSGSHVPAVVH